MVGKLLVAPFGGVWGVKKRANSSSKFLKKFYTFIYYLYQYENGSSINIVSKFKSTPCLPHDIKGIFISGPSVIGKDCVIFHHVTINAITSPDDKNFGTPVIGDNCYISTGAKIMGSAVVGNNVKIGVNCVVTTNIPDNSVVELLPSGEQIVTTKDEKIDTNYYSFDINRGWSYYQDEKWSKVTDEKVLEKLYQMRRY